MNIVCFGDSITESASCPEGWVTQLQVRLDSLSPGKHRTVNCGFSGRTSSEGLDRMGEHVLPHLPGLLLVQFGINDAYVHLWQRISRVSVNEYARNLEEIARISLERESRPVILLTHPLREKNRSNQGNCLSQAQNVAPYVAVARRVAQEKGIVCIDLPGIAEQDGIPAEEITGGDGVHLVQGGHDFFAKAIFHSLVELV